MAHMHLKFKEAGFAEDVAGDLEDAARAFPRRRPFTETFLLLTFEVSCRALGTSQRSVGVCVRAGVCAPRRLLWAQRPGCFAAGGR